MWEETCQRKIQLAAVRLNVHCFTGHGKWRDTARVGKAAHHQPCQGDRRQSLGLLNQCSLTPQHVPAHCLNESAMPETPFLIASTLSGTLSSIQTQAVPSLPWTIFPSQLSHIPVSSCCLTPLQLFGQQWVGVSQSLSAPWQSWWKEGISMFCIHWKSATSWDQYLWELKCKATSCKKSRC